MRKWELLTSALDPTKDAPLFVQLASAIADDIRAGRLRPGDALPGTRELARRLGINRNTALAGYRELVSQGLVHARSGGGTFVAEMPVRMATATSSPSTPSYALPPASEPPAMLPPDPKGTFMLFRALPDTRLLPAEQLARAFRRVLSRHGRQLLGYGDPRGHERLRRELAAMLSQTRGLASTSESIVVTRGSQQALFLVAQALLRAGDVVVVEALGNPTVWSALRSTGAEVVPLGVGEDGLDVSAVAALAKRRQVRLVYVTPHHQFPTNAVMPAVRRAELAALAREHDFAILEDDYDHEFHYEGRPVPPIAAGADGDNTIYVGSLSKVLAPGLRVGFVRAPEAVLSRLTSVRAVIDMQGDPVVECAIAELFEDGELLRHVYRMRETYRRRRDVLADALRQHVGNALDFAIPDGGMALWARVASGCNVEAWTREGERLGVVFRGARMFDVLGRDLPYLRLGFTYHDERELVEAARRMARALAATRVSAGAALARAR